MRSFLAILTTISVTGFAQQADNFPVIRVTGGYSLKKQKVSKGVSCERQISIAISPDSVLWISGLQIPVTKSQQNAQSLKIENETKKEGGTDSSRETIELIILDRPSDGHIPRKAHKIKLIHAVERDGKTSRAECEYEANKF